VDIQKSEFYVTYTKYLGFIVSTNDIEVNPNKIAIVCNWIVPSMVKGVQGFLGFCNFYYYFIKIYKHITRLFNTFICKGTLFR
jgi:hypothetical protein